MAELTDEQLLCRLRDFEDSFVERKSSGDWKKDALKTVVAFANSCPIDTSGVLFIGVKDDGSIEAAEINFDSLQKTLSDEITQAYPQIIFHTRALGEGQRNCLAVVVPASERRPHFAGPAYARDGSRTVVASEQQYQDLISQSNSKARKILESRNKQVTVARMRTERVDVMGPVVAEFVAYVKDCNLNFVTLFHGGSDYSESIPLDRILLSYDHGNNRLKFEVYPGRL